MAELLSTMIMVIGAAFSNIMDEVFRRGADLGDELKGLEAKQVAAYAEESLRLNPPIPLLFRVCEKNKVLGGGAFQKGDLACANIEAANMDRDAFENPKNHNYEREVAPYLNFGASGGPHKCWGKPLAQPILSAAAELTSLRRAAGPAGELVDAAGLPNHLVARFTPG